MATQFLWRPKAGRFGFKPAFLTVQPKTTTLTDTGTKVFRIPTPYRKVRFLRGSVSCTTAPVSGGGTITGYFKKNDASANKLEAIGTLAISATAEKFKTTTTAAFHIGGARVTKAATDNLVFSDAYTVNDGASGDKWGAFLVQINAAGTISTKAVAADQAYTSEALAIAALPSVDSDNVFLGYITVESVTDTTWTANTDDLTAASDCQSANFYDNSDGIIQADTLSAAVNLETLTTREQAKVNVAATASDQELLVDDEDCLEFHVVCTDTVGTQPVDLSICVEVAVLG